MQSRSSQPEPSANPDIEAYQTLLARALMTEIEVAPFPDLGLETGDFEDRYPGEFPSLRWEREISAAPVPN